jgi:4-hydroxybenzoate polyprenyltransferase
VSNIREWLKALRLRHWSKNLLVFLPGLLAHRILQPAILTESLLAFSAFCLCASSVYLTNDLIDLEFDRRHPTKRHRPLASAQLTPRAGAVAAVVLLLAAASLAATLGSRFMITLATYYALTWLYSLAIRRMVVVDVMALAGLYAARIVAGGAATSIPLSSWFLAFAFFMFLSLAMVKRFSEINEAIRASAPLLHGRAYGASDLPLLLAVGAGSGLGSVLVMAIYINSSDAAALYSHREVLWAVCLLLLYWIVRIWLLTTRGEMSEDPVAFSTSDPTSFWVLGLTAAAVLLAI